MPPAAASGSDGNGGGADAAAAVLSEWADGGDDFGAVISSFEQSAGLTEWEKKNRYNDDGGTAF